LEEGMLKNGKFIKEPPVKIGIYYKPQSFDYAPEDEVDVRQLLLNGKWYARKKPTLNVGAFLVIAYLSLCGVVVLINLLMGKLFG
jgi:hypothetical protein